MSETITPKKQRRIESDARIIAAATKNFGERGYTHTSIASIAKDAGVAVGLITQRYLTKEKLYTATFNAAFSKTFIEPDEVCTPRECLLTILKEIIQLSEREPEAFRFFATMWKSTDVPLENITEAKLAMKNSNRYKVLREAQNRGILPRRGLYELLSAFVSNAFAQIDICHRYHLDLPKDDFFLDAVRFRDELTESREMWESGIASLVGRMFDYLTCIYLDENSARQLHAGRLSEKGEATSDARFMAQQLIEHNVYPADRESMKSFLNFDSIRERLKTERFVSCCCRDMSGKTMHHVLLPMSSDENGRINAVLEGFYYPLEKSDP